MDALCLSWVSTDFLNNLLVDLVLASPCALIHYVMTLSLWHILDSYFTVSPELYWIYWSKNVLCADLRLSKPFLCRRSAHKLVLCATNSMVSNPAKFFAFENSLVWIQYIGSGGLGTVFNRPGIGISNLENACLVTAFHLEINELPREVLANKLVFSWFSDIL